MKTTAFLDAVSRIVQSGPTYREGGTGANGTCDCIGLIMGAMYACGRDKYDLHSSNYFARFQTDGLTALSSAEQLETGMIVYKAKNSTLGLNARYQAGGRCFNGDLLDYYHAGVVTAVDPLVITHCTSADGVDGIAVDNSIRSWTHCGHIKGLEAGTGGAAHAAVVAAVDGSTVNLRSRPHGPVVARIPVGTAVTVHQTEDGWARVTANGLTGCMMDAFLVDAAESWIRMPLGTLLNVINTLRTYVPADTKEE